MPSTSSSKKKKSKSPASAMPLSLAVVAVAAATAGALYYQKQHRSAAAAPPPLVPIVATPAPGATFTETLPKPGTSATATPIIFRVISDENGSHLKMAHLSPAEAVKVPGISPVVNALNVMAGGSDSPLSPGAQALSYTLDSDGVTATVDFNDALVKNFPGGDTAESLAIESILATVGQFGPRFVQITVAGKKIDSLGGTQSLMSPLPVPQNAPGEQTAQKDDAAK